MLVASLSVLLLGDLLHLVVIVLLAVIALLWLRRIIHVGLLEEANEIAIGAPIVCPECGKETPLHTYCGNCGTSLKALPRTRGVAAAAAFGSGKVAPHEELTTLPESTGTGPAAGAAVSVATGRATDVAATAAAPARHAWLGSRALLTLFAVIMLGAVAIAAASAYVTTQGRDKPDCPDKTLPCSGAAVGGRSLASGLAVARPGPVRARRSRTAPTTTTTRSASAWSTTRPSGRVSQQDAGFLILSAGNGAVALIVEGGPADQFDPQKLFDARQGLLKDRLLAYTTDDDAARVLLGNPILGYREGVGGLFGGTLDTSQGPSTDFSVASVAATDGTITMVATVITPVEVREAGLSIADSVVNSFTWPADEVVQ